MKRRILTLATLLALGLTLAACGNNDDEEYMDLSGINLADLDTHMPTFPPLDTAPPIAEPEQAPEPAPEPEPEAPAQGHPSGRTTFGETRLMRIDSWMVDPADHGDLFEFTFGYDFSFVTLDEQMGNPSGNAFQRELYQWYNDQTVFIQIPITITNHHPESNNAAAINQIFRDFPVTFPDGSSLASVPQGRVQMAFGDNNVSSLTHIEQGQTVETNIHLLYEGPGDYLFHFLAAALTGERFQFAFDIPAHQ